MLKLASFDLEIALTEEQLALLEDDEWEGDLWDLWPFGISVGAIKLSDEHTAEVWFDTGEDGEILPYWTPEYTDIFLARLLTLTKKGYTLVSWNGAGFDFQVLWRITGNLLAKHLVWAHLDPAFQMLCQKGFMVGLNAAAAEAGAPSKEMDGKDAPMSWLQGDYEKVIQYVKGDVLRTEAVVKQLYHRQGLQWQSKKGALMFEPFTYGIQTVINCLRLPMPDTRWMKKTSNGFVLTREGVLSWLQEDGDGLYEGM